jgi:FkbM family methyltransferase
VRLRYVAAQLPKLATLRFWQEVVAQLGRILNLLPLAPTALGRVQFLIVWIRLLAAERAGVSVPPIRVAWRGPGGRLSAEVSDLSQLRVLTEVYADDSYAVDGLSDPRTIVDLGANVGLAVLYFKARWPDARVIAVEPHPETFRRLQENTRHLQGVQLVNAAITKTSGPVALFVGERSTASSLQPTADRLDHHDVAGLSLDDLAEQWSIDHVDLLKLDIEGAEGEVLVGSKLLDRARRVVFEFHHGLSAVGLFEILAALPRFRVLSINGDTGDQALIELVAHG